MNPEAARAEIFRLARLARLALSPEEAERLAPQIAQILEFVEQLRELNLEHVPPTAHILPLENVWREDEPAPPSPPTRERILQNAPAREADFFQVKKVVEG